MRFLLARSFALGKSSSKITAGFHAAATTPLVCREGVAAKSIRLVWLPVVAVNRQANFRTLEDIRRSPGQGRLRLSLIVILALAKRGPAPGTRSLSLAQRDQRIAT
jgi:hypothetical protein